MTMVVNLGVTHINYTIYITNVTLYIPITNQLYDTLYLPKKHTKTTSKSSMVKYEDDG